MIQCVIYYNKILKWTTKQTKSNTYIIKLRSMFAHMTTSSRTIFIIDEPLFHVSDMSTMCTSLTPSVHSAYDTLTQSTSGTFRMLTVVTVSAIASQTFSTPSTA